MDIFLSGFVAVGCFLIFKLFKEVYDERKKWYMLFMQ